MRCKDYKTLKRYWSLNDSALITLTNQQELAYFLQSHSKRDILTEKEFTQFVRLKTQQRKKDWLLGRYAAKLLIQRYLTDFFSYRILFGDIELLSKQGIKPEVTVEGYHFDRVDLSLSHTENVAVAALNLQQNLKIGIDIEKTRIVNENIFRYFLSDKELGLLDKNILKKDRLITILWTLKEATLKALRIGLNGSLKGITVSLSENCLPQITISRYNLQIAHLNKPKNIYSFYETIGNYNLATVLLRN